MSRKTKKSLIQLLLIIAMTAVAIPCILLVSLPPADCIQKSTVTVTVDQSGAHPEHMSASFSVSKDKGKFQITADWWNEGVVPGFITGFIVRDRETGERIYEMHGGALSFSSKAIELRRGYYDCDFYYLGSKEAYDAYLKDNSINEAPDSIDESLFRSGTWSIPTTWGIKEYNYIKTIIVVVLGIIIGILLVILAVVSSRNEDAIVSKYDERQILMQGKGFKYAFYTMIFYYLIVSLLLWMGVSLNAEASLLILFGILAGGMIWATVTILNDAYFRADESKNKYIIFFVFISLFNVTLGISHIANNSCSSNGVFTFSGCSNLICSFASLYVLILLIIKSVIDRKEGADEES